MRRGARASRRSVCGRGRSRAGCAPRWRPTRVLFAIDPYPPGRLGLNYQKIIARGEVSKIPNGRVEWLRETGREAAGNPKVLAAAPFDFVFIDADHSFEGLRENWEGWAPSHCARRRDSPCTKGASPADRAITAGSASATRWRATTRVSRCSRRSIACWSSAARGEARPGSPLPLWYRPDQPTCCWSDALVNGGDPLMTDRRMIVTADDLGADAVINEAIVESLLRGLATHASLLVNMAGFEDACARTLAAGLQDRIGLHLNLTEGQPVSDRMRDCPRFSVDGLFRFPSRFTGLPSALGVGDPRDGGRDPRANHARARARAAADAPGFASSLPHRAQRGRHGAFGRAHDEHPARTGRRATAGRATGRSGASSTRPTTGSSPPAGCATSSTSDRSTTSSGC